MDTTNFNNDNEMSKQDDVSVAMNTFSNPTFTDEVNAAINGDLSNNDVEKQTRDPPPKNHPPPLNFHLEVGTRRSNPPSVPPPLFGIPPSSPTPLVDEDEDAEDDKFAVEDDDVEYTIVENEKMSKKMLGILRHRSSVRDPNAHQHKNVTFGKLPRRRDEPNPCVMLLLLIVFITAIIAFVLVLLVIRGTIKPPCDCKSSEENGNRAFAYSGGDNKCPMGWISHYGSCYGIVTTDKKQYSDAKTTCAGHGGYILSLESRLEFDWFVYNVIKPRKRFDTNFEGVLLGLKSNVNGTLSWESNKRFVDYTNYNLAQLSSNECYVISSENSSWERKSCTEQHVFYCERQMLS